VKDENGNILPVDLTEWLHFGGLPVGEISAKHGESISLPFPLLAYAPIVKPGTYTVTALLGWVNSPQRQIFTCRIKFKLPTSKNTEVRIHALCKKKDNESVFELLQLRAPVLVPALLAEGIAGHPQACIALRNVDSKEASEALLKLAGSNDRKVAKAAALSLLYRMPSLAEPAKPAVDLEFPHVFRAPPWPDDPGVPDPLRDQIIKTWQVKFDPRVLLAARKLLEHVDEPYQYPSEGGTIENLRALLGDDQQTKDGAEKGAQVFDLYYEHTDRMEDASVGAIIIGARGDLDQVAFLLEAMRRALNIPMRPRGNPKMGGDTFAPPPLYYLIDAVAAFRSRGWRTEGKGDSGDELALFAQLDDTLVPKPDNSSWQEIVRNALHAGSPVLRQYAAQVIPLPLTEDWEREVRRALEDKDCGVLISACSVAAKSSSKGLIQRLVHIVQREGDSDAKFAAAEAAMKLGARMELWQAWCDVIPDRHISYFALDALIHGTIESPNGVANPTDIDHGLSENESSLVRDAWRTFLEKNRALLEMGKRVPSDDPSIVALLTATHFETPSKDGSERAPSQK
jgi:hypothetical protein